MASTGAPLSPWWRRSQYQSCRWEEVVLRIHLTIDLEILATVKRKPCVWRVESLSHELQAWLFLSSAAPAMIMPVCLYVGHSFSVCEHVCVFSSVSLCVYMFLHACVHMSFCVCVCCLYKILIFKTSLLFCECVYMHFRVRVWVHVCHGTSVEETQGQLCGVSSPSIFAWILGIKCRQTNHCSECFTSHVILLAPTQIF